MGKFRLQNHQMLGFRSLFGIRKLSYRRLSNLPKAKQRAVQSPERQTERFATVVRGLLIIQMVRSCSPEPLN